MNKHMNRLKHYFFYKISSENRTINALSTRDCDAWKGFQDSTGVNWYVSPIKDLNDKEQILADTALDNKIYFMDINEFVESADKLVDLTALHDFILFHDAAVKEARDKKDQEK